jgi:lycopene beta-cyclase
MNYDFIFAGFGLSGMSLLHEMSKYSGFEKNQILVIDMDQKKSNDRTWSFWSKELYGYESAVKKSWQMGFVFEESGKSIPLELKSYKYHTIRGIDFYDLIRKELSKFSNITFVYDKIEAVEESGLVKCENHQFQGEKVFKSYFLREEIPRNLGNAFIWQHFKGWIIKTEKEEFNKDEFILMDYRDCSDDRTNFVYVLPYTNNTALIEFTEFSPDFYTQEEYDEKLKNYIEKYVTTEKYEVIEEEFNAIPMTDHQFDGLVEGNIIKIGTIGGYVKASSGYCFTRTIEKNIKLAKAIMQNEEVTKKTTESPFRYAMYDSAMLNLLADRVLLGKTIFPAMFRTLKGDNVFKFLDERMTFSQEVWMMSTVPKKWHFIKFFLNKGLRWLLP